MDLKSGFFAQGDSLLQITATGSTLSVFDHLSGERMVWDALPPSARLLGERYEAAEVQAFVAANPQA